MKTFSFPECKDFGIQKDSSYTPRTRGNFVMCPVCWFLIHPPSFVNVTSLSPSHIYDTEFNGRTTSATLYRILIGCHSSITAGSTLHPWFGIVSPPAA